MTISTSSLESHLWEAANILRGSPVDRTDWKSFILPLLFFKRISDVYDEEYNNYYGDFKTETHAVTGRVDFDYVKNLLLRAGVTYLDVNKDLDIEKSILSFEGMYTVADDYHLEIKYNVYNYDDFVILDRYYTANVVWVNVAWDLHFE